MPYEHKNHYLRLGLNIAYYRKQLGLTQDELAEAADISRTHMSNIEAPGVKKAVSLNVLFRIADALEVDPGKLLELRS
jgi:transcriptional regulator with XRE-family HTH domain